MRCMRSNMWAQHPKITRATHPTISIISVCKYHYKDNINKAWAGRPYSLYTMKKIGFFFLLFSFVLSACGADTTETPVVEEAISIDTPAPTTETATISPAVDVVSTSNLRFPTPNPTQAFINSICSTYPLIDNNKISPDGQWIAVSCEDLSALEEANAPFVKIVKLDNSVEWTVTLKELTGFNFISYGNGDGWFPGILLIDHWYKDSQFVFLVPYYVIDGDRTDGLGLYRFDTKTGKVSPYLPVGSTGYSFAFSHDDEYFVYHYAQEDYIIHIVSIETGNTIQLEAPKNAEFIHDFLWSPNNSMIAFEGENYGNEDYSTTLYLLDLMENKFTTLLNYKRYEYHPKAWYSETQLVLESYENDALVKDYFDINTKELERAQNP